MDRLCGAHARCTCTFRCQKEYLSDYVITTTVENQTYGSYELQCATVFSRYLRIKYPTIRRHRYFWSIVRTTVLSSACHYNYIRFYFIFAPFKILCLRCHNIILYYVILWRHRFFFYFIYVYTSTQRVIRGRPSRQKCALVEFPRKIKLKCPCIPFTFTAY